MVVPGTPSTFILNCEAVPFPNLILEMEIVVF
ncbi:MAG: hypothetical protein ACJAY9_001478 [Flavobacteriales bacterium]|jgi:hypothetical protein